MKDLQGFYNEDVLQDLLFNGEINHLSFVYHHSEEKKAAFLEYCQKKGLEADDKAAQRFIEDELKEEEESHSFMD